MQKYSTLRILDKRYSWKYTLLETSTGSRSINPTEHLIDLHPYLVDFTRKSLIRLIMKYGKRVPTFILRNSQRTLFSSFIDPWQPQEDRIFFAGSSWPANQTAGLLLPSYTGPSRPLAAVGAAVKSRAIHRITDQAPLGKKRRIGSGQSRFTDTHGYPIPPYPAASFGKSGTKRSGARHRLPKGSCFFFLLLLLSCFPLFLGFEMMRFILDKENAIKCPLESISIGSNPL